LFYGEDFDKIKDKLDQKYNELLETLPEELKNDKTVLEKLKDAVDYA